MPIDLELMRSATPAFLPKSIVTEGLLNEMFVQNFARDINRDESGDEDISSDAERCLDANSKRLEPLLRLCDSGEVDLDQGLCVEEALELCLSVLFDKQKSLTIQQIFKLYLKVRMTKASNLVVRTLVSRSKEKIKAFETYGEADAFFTHIPRVHEAPLYQLLVWRLLGEKFFQKEG